MYIYVNGMDVLEKVSNRLHGMLSSPTSEVCLAHIPPNSAHLVQVHTGERPFACPHPNCDKDFTRAEALTKHLRALHATTIATIPRNASATTLDLIAMTEPDRPVSSFDLKKRSAEAKRQAKGKMRPLDYDLMEDEDLMDRLPPIRGRVPFWSTSEADLKTVEAIRKRYPHRHAMYVKGRIQMDDSDDDFDEGVSERYPAEGVVMDELMGEDGVVGIVSRPRWQVKYMMAKAKFMLVTEENTMRREELKALMREEQELHARGKNSQGE
jgi:hypothetical protein